MISIAVCDDEPNMVTVVKEHICNYFIDKKIKFKVYTFTESQSLIDSSLYFDAIFLDIKMPSPDGMKTAHFLRAKGFSGIIIFLTVLEEYVFDAFAVEAFDYLLKPFDVNSFTATMNRLMQKINAADKDYVIIEKNSETLLLRYEDIIYCEVINRKIYLHLVNNTTIDFYDKMNNLITKLDNRFVQCHRSYLINLQHLQGYTHDSVQLSENAIVPISRLRYKQFCTSVIDYLKKGR